LTSVSLWDICRFAVHHCSFYREVSTQLYFLASNYSSLASLFFPASFSTTLWRSGGGWGDF